MFCKCYRELRDVIRDSLPDLENASVGCNAVRPVCIVRLTPDLAFYQVNGKSYDIGFNIQAARLLKNAAKAVAFSYLGHTITNEEVIGYPLFPCICPDAPRI